MANFIKIERLVPENGSVSVKTYESLRRALSGNLEFGVIRAQGLGDVLMSVPVVDALKERNPGSKIVFYSSPQYLSILKRFSCIDRLGTLEEMDTSAILVDLMGKIDYLPLCAQAHRMELLADEAMVPRNEVNYAFFFSASAEEREWAGAFLWKRGISGRDKVIGIHLKSYADIRTWGGNWDLVRLLLRRFPKSYKIVLFEKNRVEVPQDIRSSRVVNLGGAVTVAQLVSLVSACDLLVAPDSGLMHLAGMMRVPCVALFGSIDPDFRIRYYPTVEAIWPRDRVPCAPCWDWQTWACAGKAEYKLCMREISPERVFAHVKEGLRG